MITFKRGEVIKLPLKRTFDRVFLTPDIAKQIIPREVQPGVTLSSVTGCLQVKDNLHDIKVRRDHIAITFYSWIFNEFFNAFPGI